MTIELKLLKFAIENKLTIEYGGEWSDETAYIDPFFIIDDTKFLATIGFCTPIRLLDTRKVLKVTSWEHEGQYDFINTSPQTEQGLRLKDTILSLDKTKDWFLKFGQIEDSFADATQGRNFFKSFFKIILNMCYPYYFVVKEHDCDEYDCDEFEEPYFLSFDQIAQCPLIISEPSQDEKIIWQGKL